MKVSREQADKNRETILEAASKLFRARGVDGVGISEVMRAGGLTHGGFYNQFDSKEALAAEACGRSLANGAAKWRRLAGEGDNGLDAITADYLSARNRDAPETGCALIALGPDAARKGGELANAFRTGFEELASVLEDAGVGGRDAALARMAQLVGTMVLARAVDDPALSEALLAANRRALGVAA